MENWYDEGEGSEHMKQQIAKSALENPVPHSMCIGCEYKKRRKARKKVGIIINLDSGGDTYYQVVLEKDYKVILAFSPTKKFKYSWEKKEYDVLDSSKYQEMVGAYLYDVEKDDNNEKVLKWFSTQTFVPEKIDFSEYNVIGILTLPG